jgi:two-component system, OmpR family, sensor histidine kinase KdpD
VSQAREQGRARGRGWLLTRLSAALLSLAAVAAVSVAVALLEPFAPVLSLGVLYLFAVLPVAAIWGLPYAIPVSVVSMLAFNWLFLPPRHTFRLADSENWVALAVYVVTAISVSGLSARARRRAAEAEQRRREAVLAAEVSALLLEERKVAPSLERIAGRAAILLGSAHGRIELGAEAAGDGAEGHSLVAGDRVVGRLLLDPDEALDPDATARVCSTIGALLATAIDRESLAREARASDERRRRDAVEAEALRRSDAVKTAVLRSVSHDLRSPITAMTTASEVLADLGDALADADRKELVASILVQLRRLDRLVSNLLELSRLEAGAAAPRREPWTIDGLVARVLDAVESGGERIRVEVPTDVPPVEVDPSQIERALANVLENALKFTPAELPVVLRAESRDGEVEIRVVDAGPGIPAHERERVFEPFVRGVGATGDRGSGLGLAIARGFANVNGGRLWVEEGPGGGAVFVLALPGAAVIVGPRA